jgi:hypothetical protein
LAEADEVDLRDLRSVVVAADDAARDDESRELASRLRDALTQRVDKEHGEWLAELGSTIEEGRVVRALRLSSRPPKAGARFPAEISSRLAELAGAALTAEVSQDRWAAVLDAVAYSPVRRAVKPAGVPAEPNEALLAAVKKLAGRVPDIAQLFGIQAEAAPARPPRAGGRRGRGGKGGGGHQPRAAAPPTTEPPTTEPPTTEPPTTEPPTTEPPADTVPDAPVEPSGTPEEAVAEEVADAPAVSAVETPVPPSDIPEESRAEPAPGADPDPWQDVLLEQPMGSLRRSDEDDSSAS